jgi:GNAT superfamily N-acetyltransferase
MPGSYPDGLVTAEYQPSDSDECLALERLAPQGGAYRLSFRRSTFHRRAENFDRHKLLVARLDGRLVGVAAVAWKDVVLLGKPLRAAFYFDLRVHPDVRGREIGKRLSGEIAWFGTNESDFGYSYMMGDNATAIRVARFFQSEVAAGYAYLVLPTYRERAPRLHVERTTLDEAHATLLHNVPPFDLYTDPRKGGRTDPWVASWIVRDGERVAACSAWDNTAILAEVIEAEPPVMNAAAHAFRTWPLRLARLPHLPVPGEQLRSWYLFDVSGDPDLVVDLVRAVSAEARARGVDWLYLPHVPGDAWPEVVRAEVPSVFAPLVPYHLLAGWARGPFPKLNRIYVDVRDL